MKYVVLILVMFLTTNCKEVRRKSFEASDKTLVGDRENFTIYKIDSISEVYLIYARKKNKNYKIVSKIERDAYDECREKLFVGNSYDLGIESILYPKNSKLMTSHYLKGVNYHGILIKIEEENSIKDLYVSSNVNGLCYKNNSASN